MISSTPDAAYELCTEFYPSCDKPFKYYSPKIESSTEVTPTDLPKYERLNSTTTGSKKESKHSKKKKKNLQSQESEYTSSVDSESAQRNYEDLDEEYDETEEEDDSTGQNRVEIESDTVLALPGTPFDNDVSPRSGRRALHVSSEFTVR